LTAAGVAAQTQDELLAALASLPAEELPVKAGDRTLIAYADAVTRAPAGIREAHVTALRAVGFDDRAIHDACAIVAYFAFVNRIADGLGVELEDGA
jgi:alkylhydroperoxidase family enzyme